MNWLLQNWFWLVVGGLFLFMHMGHGGHGGHGGHSQEKPRNDTDGDAPQTADEPRRGTGHQH